MSQYPKISMLLLLTFAHPSCSFFQSGFDETKVTIAGNIEVTEVRLAFKIPGTIIELAIEEGDSIHKGELIARMDAEQLERQRDQAVASLRSAQARKEELLALLEFQKHHVQAQITQRETDVASSRAALQKARKGPRDREIEEAHARLQSAQIAFEKAEKDWHRAENLIKTEDISKSQYDQFKAAYEGSRATRLQAEQRLELLREGSREEDISMAEAAVARAEAGVELAQTGTLEIKKTEKSLKALQAEVERAEAGIAVIESQLKDTELHSPITGVVLTKPAEVGEVAMAGGTVAVIADLERPWIRGFIQQSDLGRVKIGNRVRVNTDSFPEKDYFGRVSFIASDAEFTPKQIQTQEERVKLVYRVKIEIANENQELKLNMPVDAEILLEDSSARDPQL
jgi:HlyD family secretion protein